MDKTKKGLFRKSLPKIIALLLAIVSWFIVMDYENPIVTRTINDLEFKIVGQEELFKRGLIVQEIEIKNVNVDVRGKWRNIMDIDSSDILTYIDVTGYDVGEALIPINAKSSDTTLSIGDKYPPKVKVVFDKKSKVEKSVKIVTKGELKEGLELGNLDAYNKKIGVTGPSNIIKNIAYLEAKIHLDGKEKSFIENIKLIPKDSEGNVVENVVLDTTILDVKIPILTERDIKIRINSKGTINEDYKISSMSVEPAVVKIKGDIDIINKIDFINTEEIDISGLTNSLEKEVKLIIDKDLQVINNVKTLVKIDIKPKEVKRLTFLASEIDIKEKKDNYTYSIDSSVEEINVDLIDIRDNILKINKSDIKLQINVKDLKPGQYELPILLKNMSENTGEIEHIIKPKKVIITISE